MFSLEIAKEKAYAQTIKGPSFSRFLCMHLLFTISDVSQVEKTFLVFKPYFCKRRSFLQIHKLVTVTPGLRSLGKQAFEKRFFCMCESVMIVPN